MAVNRSNSLRCHTADFADGHATIACRSAASEINSAGLRLLEKGEAAMQSLRDALNQGDASGAATDFDFEIYLASRRRVPGV